MSVTGGEDRTPILDETVEVPSAELGTDESDLLDHLADEYARLCRVGSAPSIETYVARHPRIGAKLRRLLSTVQMVERLKRSPGGPAHEEPTTLRLERLGEFHILRELGRGGMGTVYEAVQESLERHVALKVVYHCQLDEVRLARFRREAQALALLHHTNIVPIYAFGEHEGIPYYAMQLIRGGGLDAILRRWRKEGAPPPTERWRFAALVCRQAAEAIHYAHEQGIIHRDVKPSNILIDEHQGVWLTDFGLAKLVGDADLTASGDVIGTLRYLAPEVLCGESGPRTDVYGLGMTIYELATLQPPFGDLAPSSLLQRVSSGEPDRPRKIEPAIPRDLETILLKAIAREPEQRYASAAALADDLRCYLEDRPIQARRATALERAWRWCRRNRVVAALSATAAVSLLVAAIVGWVAYARTMKALQGEEDRRREAEVANHRAQDNEALSLEALSELFERLASRENLPPPPPGRPMRDRPQGGPPARSGPPVRPGAPHQASSADDAELLQTVLTFYTRFANLNASNPRLQGEAAWAYRKVASLCRRLGRDEEADRAEQQAITMLEELVTRYPENREYRRKLVDTFLIADPWSADDARLATMDERLRRASELAETLVAETSRDTPSLLPEMLVQAKWGAVLQRMGMRDEAEACYRRAIALQRIMIEQGPWVDRTRTDRAATRESLARLLLETKRGEEARALLEEAAADLEAVALGDQPPPSLADRFVNLAESFQNLGLPDRATAMQKHADEARALTPRHPPEHPPRDPLNHDQPLPRPNLPRPRELGVSPNGIRAERMHNGSELARPVHGLTT
jgi:tetratricopeptide (TPR) repeat protein/tRNA A-37 threonylcarbamoyl transferase component Bud32